KRTMAQETWPNNGTPAVAVWLSAINVAKARIARLIITIHREGTNAAISNPSSSAVQSLVGSAATNPVQTFTNYVYNCTNDALICASCSHESSLKQTRNVNNHLRKHLANACKFRP